jgi:hypothetical protein
MSPSSPPASASGIAELKTRARLGLKALRSGDKSLLQRAAQVSGRQPFEPPEWKLRHVLALVAQSVGFRHWEHARTVLGGDARAGEDMGRFWHGPRCESLLNHWFASHADASAMHAGAGDATLLAYGRQFVVVGAPYLHEIGITERIPDATAQRFDAVREYGSKRWLAWCDARLRAPVETWVR